MSDPVSDDMAQVRLVRRLRGTTLRINGSEVPISAQQAVMIERALAASVPPTPPEREAETCPLHGKRHCQCWRDGIDSCCSCGQASAPADSAPAWSDTLTPTAHESMVDELMEAEEPSEAGETGR